MNDVECVNGVADVTNTGVSLVRSYLFYLFIYLFIQHFYSALFINKYALMRYA